MMPMVLAGLIRSDCTCRHNYYVVYPNHAGCGCSTRRLPASRGLGNMPRPRPPLIDGCEAMHRNKSAKAGFLSYQPIHSIMKRLIIGFDAKVFFRLGQADVPGNDRCFAYFRHGIKIGRGTV